MNNKVKI